MKGQKFVHDFYAPVAVICLPRTDGGFGIFAPNQIDSNKPPHCVGVGRTKKGAWINSAQRIEKASAGSR